MRKGDLLSDPSRRTWPRKRRTGCESHPRAGRAHEQGYHPFPALRLGTVSSSSDTLTRMSVKALYKIDVRSLAECLFQERSIGIIAPTGKSALHGMKAHKKMQSRGTEGHRALTRAGSPPCIRAREVELRRVFRGARFDLELSGRAEGIYERDGLTHIVEIKSTRHGLEEPRPDGNPAHAAQLGIYGWIKDAPFKRSGAFEVWKVNTVSSFAHCPSNWGKIHKTAEASTDI
jgi:hypothetical protein